jgi:Na+-translocating ferredoxin:NAD+ oxidoreductase RnfD subunit
LHLNFAEQLRYVFTQALPDGARLDAVTMATPLDTLKTQLHLQRSVADIQGMPIFGALGGHEYKTKEVAILTAFLLVFSVLVFVKGLTLPFPIWPDALEPYVPSFLK